MLVHIFISCTFLVGFSFNIPIPSPTEDGLNYELLGGGFEGDMILPDGFDPTKEYDAKGVAIFGPRQWPNKVIPYDISGITDAGQRSMIEAAMRTITDATSTPIAGSTALQYGNGCSASVGYSNGQRSMTLQQNGCFRSGTIQHEFLHILGFYHEQSRPDRDTYVTVNYANIESGKEHNFNKYAWGTSVLDQHTAYDLGSIMHYSATSFSKNGQQTITPKDKDAKIGQRDKLSATDIAEIRAFYGCSS